MTTAPSPAAANVPRSRQNGLGRLAAWCYDHRRRVLGGWVLVPAVMQLLGTANWWLPRWMARATPDLAIEPDADRLAGGGLGCARPVSVEASE
jgi:hypothetical protein